MSGTAPGDTHHIHAGGKFLPFNTLSAPLTCPPFFIIRKQRNLGITGTKNQQIGKTAIPSGISDFGFVSICRHWKLSSTQHL